MLKSPYRSWLKRSTAPVLSGATLILCSVVVKAATPDPETTYWKTRGNGFVLELHGNDYRMFDTTRLSLLPTEHGSIADGSLLYGDLPAYSLAQLEGMSERIPGLPQAQVTDYIDDPQKLFDIFWTNIDQYYSLFNFLPKNEWHRLYQVYRPQVHPDTTPDELWTLFAQMIKPLNDGHTFLFDFSGKHPGVFSRPPSPSSWMLAALNEYETVIHSYLDASSVEVLGNDNLIAGTIGQQVGYVNILSYSGFSQTSLPLPAPGDVEYSILSQFASEAIDTAPFLVLLDHLMLKFEGTQALIIDLRFNGGGSGELVKALSNRLTARQRLAFTYRIRNGGYEQFDPPVREFLTPQTPAYLHRPVIVLTSNNSESAADLQAMILRELPNVKLIGENTYGIFSEEIPRQIPLRTGGEFQGWLLFTSTQRLYDVHGESFERRGVPPNVEVHPDRDQLAAGHDNMLEAALRFVGPVNVTRSATFR